MLHVVVKSICPNMHGQKSFAGAHKLTELKGKDKFVRRPDSGGQEKGAVPDVMEDSYLYMGVSAIRGSSVVSPELGPWVGRELSSEYLALEERRKALEERKVLQGGDK